MNLKRILSLVVCLSAVSVGVIALTTRPEYQEPDHVKQMALAVSQEHAPLPQVIEPIPLDFPDVMPNWDRCESVQLSKARELITEGKVRSVFQPHEGEVGMLLRDGESVCFQQPHLDWVIAYSRENSSGEQPILLTE